MLGAIKGRRNDEWLNGSHPALLVSLRCNSDVQVPYRFPITAHTHANELCSLSECCGDDDAAIVFAAQVAQDSQCGYACDYGNKRGPLAVNEAKEMQKGISQLGERLLDSKVPHSLPYVFNRFKQRLLSDSYGKGVVRSAVETTNLQTQSRDNNVCAAETVIAGPLTVTFLGKEFVDLLEKVSGTAASPTARHSVHVDRRVPRRAKLNLDKDDAFFYGFRGTNCKVRYLSAFEFKRWVDVVMPRLPTSMEAHEKDSAKGRNQVSLTASGEQKLKAMAEDETVDLIPGRDYMVISEPSEEAGWLSFANHVRTESWRHSWIMRFRQRPIVPVFAGSPLPKGSAGQDERNSMLLMAYFHPWTLIDTDHCSRVPFLGSLKQEHESYLDARRAWQQRGVECEDSLVYIRNFTNKTRSRASGRDDDKDEQSDDLLSDEELVVSHDMLPEVVVTNVGGRVAHDIGSEDNAGIGISHNENSTHAMSFANDVWGCNVLQHTTAKTSVSVANLKEIFAAARASQRCDDSTNDVRSDVPRDPSSLVEKVSTGKM